MAFDKRFISYWTLLELGLHNSVIIMNSFQTSFFFNKRFLKIPRVYRKVCDNYFFNYLRFPTSSSTKFGLQGAKKRGERRTGRAPTAFCVLISNSECMKLQQGRTQLPLLVGTSKVWVPEAENDQSQVHYLKVCEAVCYDFSAQPCCLHQGEGWRGGALLLQCS